MQIETAARLSGTDLAGMLSGVGTVRTNIRELPVDRVGLLSDCLDRVLLSVRRWRTERWIRARLRSRPCSMCRSGSESSGPVPTDWGSIQILTRASAAPDPPSEWEEALGWNLDGSRRLKDCRKDGGWAARLKCRAGAWWDVIEMIETVAPIALAGEAKLARSTDWWASACAGGGPGPRESCSPDRPGRFSDPGRQRRTPTASTMTMATGSAVRGRTSSTARG